MAPVRESGTAIAAAGGALWAAAATCGPFPFPPALLLPPLLLPGADVAAELGDRLAALGGGRIPFGSAGAAAGFGFGFGFESAEPLDLVPVEDEDEDEDGEEDIGAWSG
jgi:hypothetical protein